jgi:hypothetical protein
VKVSGTGRIVLWRGGSLWIGRVGEPTGDHAHHAVQITLALTPGGLRFRMPGKDWTRFQAALVPAHQPHAFDARGEGVAHLFTEPESREGRVLQQRYRGIEPLEGEAPRRAAERLGSLFAQRAPDASLVQEGRTLTRALAGGDEAAQPLDPRIARAIEVLRTRLGNATRATPPGNRSPTRPRPAASPTRRTSRAPSGACSAWRRPA